MKNGIIHLVLISLLICPLLSGCWSRVEINDLAIVTEAGMDLSGQGGLLLSVNVLVTAGRGRGTVREAGQQGPRVMTLSAGGRDVMDAMLNLQLKLPRRLFWGHMRALVLGEELARTGVWPHINYWLRHPEPRMTMHVVVVRHRAEQFLHVEPSLRRFLADTIDEMNRTRLGVSTSLRDFAADLAGGDRDPATPFYDVESAAEETGSDPGLVRMAGAAVFRGDRMVAVLPPGDHWGLAWLRSAPGEATLTVELAGRGLVSARLLRSSASRSVRVSQGKIVVTAVAQEAAEIFESTAGIDLSDPATYESLHQLFERELERRMRSTYSRLARELRADPMGVGQELRHAYPAVWLRLKPHWHDVLPSTQLVVKASVQLERSGMQGKLLPAPQEGDSGP